MPFITQGKTNWKFLLIVIVLAAVVVGFSWWLSKNIFIEGPLIKPTKPDEKYCEKDSDCVLNYTGSETCPSCSSDDYQCVSLEYYNKVLWPEWEKNHKGILCEGCPMVTDKLQCICEKSLCKKIIKDETADWKNYSDPKAVFTFKYPNDWEIKTDYQYKSASCRVRPDCEGIHYIFLNKVSDSRPSSESEVGKFGIGINMPQCAGIKMDSLPGNNWICVFDENSEILDIYEKIKNSFKLIEEIKTGKVEINYEEIKSIQKSVDEGHEPWRLNPIMVLRGEMSVYGFNPDTDYNTLSPVPDAATQKKYGTEITEVNFEITHRGKTYVITLIQPITGPDKIWTISNIELK